MEPRGGLQHNTKIVPKRAFTSNPCQAVWKWQAAHSIYLMMFNITKIVPVLLVDKPSKNMKCYLLYILIQTHASSFLGTKCSRTKSLKLWIAFISSLWIEKTAKALCCSIRFRENILIRFKVLKHIFESTEDIGVVKIMLRNCDTAGNVLVVTISHVGDASYLRKASKQFLAVLFNASKDTRLEIPSCLRTMRKRSFSHGFQQVC